MSAHPFRWRDLPRPFWVLGPMEEITDAAFRRLVWELGPPDVFLTEFVRVEQIPRKGTLAQLRRLARPFDTAGVPVVAQIYGVRPEAFLRAAVLLREEGWVAIDINMGCPARQVRRSGAGSGLIRTPSLAREILAAVREGAAGLPVSVKTRIGWDSPQEEWLQSLLEAAPDALTVHARTALQMYGGRADWGWVRRAVELRDRLGVPTVVVGNGDIGSVEEGLERHRQVGCDGLMAARAVVAAPWFWSREGRPPPEERRLWVARRHLELFLEAGPAGRNVQGLKKFFLAYLRGTPWLAAHRERLVRALTEQDFLLLFPSLC